MTDRMNAAQLDAILKGLTPLLIPKDGIAEAATPQLDLAAPAAAAPQKRCGCGDCKRKLTLTDYECGKCKKRYCATHRLPEQHVCPHDFRKEGQAQLTAANPRVIANKIDHI